jgi:hypothetical protein
VPGVHRRQALAGRSEGLCGGSPRTTARRFFILPTRTMLTYQHSLADIAVAEVHFDDGSIRTAWETADGLQYVEDDNGERVYGVWFIPPDDGPVPVIVDAK